MPYEQEKRMLEEGKCRVARKMALKQKPRSCWYCQPCTGRNSHSYACSWLLRRRDRWGRFRIWRQRGRLQTEVRLSALHHKQGAHHGRIPNLHIKGIWPLDQYFPNTVSFFRGTWLSMSRFTWTWTALLTLASLDSCSPEAPTPVPYLPNHPALLGVANWRWTTSWWLMSASQPVL